MITPIEAGPAGFVLVEIDVLSDLLKEFPMTDLAGAPYASLHGKTAWMRPNADDDNIADCLILDKYGDWSGLIRRIPKYCIKKD